MEAVPRSTFTPHHVTAFADHDIALPLGCGQTMPQPSHLARVLEVLEPGPESRVLEIGTGSGYMTALLARLSGEVVSIERFKALAAEAEVRLHGLDLGNATVIWADGLAIGPAMGSFDRIVIGAALDREPTALLDRLSEGGVLVYPLGVESSATPAKALQTVMKLTRAENGSVRRQALWSCRLQAALPGQAESL